MTEEQLRDQLDAVYASTSWKITAPLRATSGLFRKIQQLLYRPNEPVVSDHLSLPEDDAVPFVIIDPDMSRDALNILSELNLLTKQEKKEDAHRH
ncbi:hypothetical protein [Undibacterium sp. Di24W]|uniref:hypothetical protein n=1 Tax=Undibacterium sp. Di24W TaxID=3413033 RepID=UPI003BF0E34E